MPVAFEILHYITRDGKDLYEEWLDDLDVADADRIDAYVTRMESGNFGAARSVGDGISELKIDFGPGYRVYYLRDGQKVVVLLCVGVKDTQFKDIANAKAYAADYWRRK